MNIKDQILQEFNVSIDHAVLLFCDQLRKIFEEEQKKKSEILSEKSSEEEKTSPPHKRHNSPPVSNPRKFKKTSETKSKSQDPAADPNKDPFKGQTIESKPNGNPIPEPSEKTMETPMIPLKDNPEVQKSLEGINVAIKELQDCSKDRATFLIDSLISIVKSEPHLKILNIFIKLQAGKSIKKLSSEEEVPELKAKYNKLLDMLKNLASQSNPSSNTKWSYLHKQLQDSFTRKNDPELSANFKKFSEGLSEKIEDPDMPHIEKIISMVIVISKEWRNQDIQQKASLILRKCREKFPKMKILNDNSKMNLADRLSDILPGITITKK